MRKNKRRVIITRIIGRVFFFLFQIGKSISLFSAILEAIALLRFKYGLLKHESRGFDLALYGISILYNQRASFTDTTNRLV